MTQPAQPSPLSTATLPLESAPALAPESDPLGDEIEQLLAQLDSANTAADRDIEQLPAPW